MWLCGCCCIDVQMIVCGLRASKSSVLECMEWYGVRLYSVMCSTWCGFGCGLLQGVLWFAGNFCVRGVWYEYVCRVAMWLSVGYVSMR